MAQGLAEKGNMVDLFVTTMGEEGDLESSSRNLRIKYFKCQFSIMGMGFSFQLMLACLSKIPKCDIVLIHSIYKFHSTFIAFLARKHNTPYVIRPHGSLDPFLVGQRRSLLKLAYISLFEKKSFLHASAIQYSSKLDQNLAQLFIKNSGQGLLIPEGIDEEQFNVIPNLHWLSMRFPRLKNKTTVLFLGRFHRKKGLLILIQAFQLVAKKHDSVYLILAGNGEKNVIDEVSQLISALDLGGRVELTGYVSDEDRRNLYGSVDIFVLPSYGENFGLGVVEAMCCRVPVIVSNKVGIFDFISEFNTGLVVSCNANELAHAIEFLVLNPNERVKMGLNGRELVLSKLTQKIMARNMNDAFHQIVDNAKTNTFLK